MRSSLTRRLLTLYITTILVVVGLAGVLVFAMMRRALYSSLDAALHGEAVALAGRLEAEDGRIEFEQGAVASSHLDRAGSMVQIADEHGRVVFASTSLQGNRAMIDRAMAAARTQRPIWFTTSLRGGDDARVIAMHVLVPPEEDHRTPSAATTALVAWIVVARSLTPTSNTLGQLASVLAIAVGAATLVALFGGLIVSRHGTKPVRMLADRVGKVDPADPQLDLAQDRVPVELQPVVRTIEQLLARVRGELVRQRRLTADVAHDLRTPVAGVRALLDVCLQREREAHEYVESIDKARAALRQLSELLADVLTLSRVDAGVDGPVWTDVSLEETLAAAVATVRPLAAAREVPIQIEQGAPATWRTDRGKLLKVLTNLVSNAVEHSPRGTVVRVAARVQHDHIEIEVCDRGPGVSPDMRERIFDRFVRSDIARAGANEHYGLGLPIAAGLARILGGEVRLDAAPSCGSRFVLHLPRRP